MSDANLSKVLEQEHNFSFKDLIQLSGETDFYREVEIQEILHKSYVLQNKLHDLQVIIDKFQSEGIPKLLWKLRIKLIKLVYDLNRNI